MAKGNKTVKKKDEKPKEPEEFKCRYCGLIFDSQNSLENHVQTECIGKMIHQRTTIIGKLEKFVDKIKPNGENEVYDIKEGIKVLQKMENIRKKGNIPIIKIKSVKHAKELKKVIDFRDEILYVVQQKRDFLNFIIGLKPKLVIGKFTEADEKIFKMNKTKFVSSDRVKIKITNTCAEVKPEDMAGILSGKEIKKMQKGPELKLVLDLSLVDDSKGKKKILQSGKLAVPLIEKKLEEMENTIGEEQTTLSLEDRLENIEKKLDEKVGKGSKISKNEEEDVDKKTNSKEIKKEESVAKELNLLNLKEDYLKIDKKDEEEKEKKGFLSSLSKKREEKEKEKKKKTLKEAAMENLAKSKDLEDYEKASIIVAHVLKQFLEIKMKCKKELTYMELIEKLKSFHLPLDYLDDIIKFYKDMHVQEYKDEVKVNFQEAHALAERVINDLA